MGRAKKPRVVIIGGGFGGISAAKVLRTSPVDVLLIDRSNHHLFQPLLYQVATAALPPSDIVAPIRWILRRQQNTAVMLAEVVGLDPDRREVTAVGAGGRCTVNYDYLIVAAGSRHSYFGRDSWEASAPGLKTLSDAQLIRSLFLKSFEKAEWESSPERRQQLLTFVVVGGGPTGVELAGILPEIARRTLKNNFRRLDPASTRVVLVEAGPRLLPTFSEETSERVLADLVELGVDVRLGTPVTDITPHSASVGNETILTSTIFWAAGNEASSLGRATGGEIDKNGRVIVDENLAVPLHPEVFVVGDLALSYSGETPNPGVAQVAIQGGRAAARNISNDIAGRSRQPFRYFDKGNAATIGRNRAIVELGSMRLYGRPAWWFWLFLHILYLTGFRNRLSVLIEWGYSYFSYERGARIIQEERLNRITREERVKQSR